MRDTEAPQQASFTSGAQTAADAVDGLVDFDGCMTLLSPTMRFIDVGYVDDTAPLLEDEEPSSATPWWTVAVAN